MKFSNTIAQSLQAYEFVLLDADGDTIAALGPSPLGVSFPGLNFYHGDPNTADSVIAWGTGGSTQIAFIGPKANSTGLGVKIDYQLVAANVSWLFITNVDSAGNGVNQAQTMTAGVGQWYVEANLLNVRQAGIRVGTDGVIDVQPGTGVQLNGRAAAVLTQLQYWTATAAYALTNFDNYLPGFPQNLTVQVGDIVEVDCVFDIEQTLAGSDGYCRLWINGAPMPLTATIRHVTGGRHTLSLSYTFVSPYNATVLIGLTAQKQAAGGGTHTVYAFNSTLKVKVFSTR